MDDDVFAYLAELPDGIHEMVTPCADGYTVYIDEALSETGRIKAYRHALEHIKRNDFKKEVVQKIEAELRKN